MKVLALDTSAGIDVAVVDTQAAGRVLSRVTLEDGRHHAESLSDLIAEAVRQAGADSLASLGVEALAVGTGPAPFTGLRAGLVSARTLAQVLGVPIVGVCSLEVLARQALDLLPADAVAVPVTDARRHEVYWGVYRANGPADVQVVTAPKVGDPQLLLGSLPRQEATVFGAGAALYDQVLPVQTGLPTAVSAAALAQIAAHRLQEVEAGNLDAETIGEASLQPLYLRRPDIHPGGKKK